jgi:excinuclease UvrABC ATPase subunit
MIEHHLDVIAQADWVIDLGPGGGARGGELIAAASPDKLVEHPTSITAAMLRASGYHLLRDGITTGVGSENESSETTY